jgi:rare lipoprotein A
MEPNQYEVFGIVYEILPTNLGYLEIGVASWYGKKFHGRLTAMGETYDMYAMTAAHKSLPLPSVVRVTNLDSGKSIQVRVNDRGPFHDDRLIDLSYAAAKALGFESKGTAPVVVEAIDLVNHPGLVAVEERAGSYYLQVGAFAHRGGAEKKLIEVYTVLPDEVDTRILQSETETGTLYKVWIGPLSSLEEEERLALMISDRNLGNPLRVKVD